VSELYGGIETGGTTCVCALASGSGELVARSEIPTTDPDTTLGLITSFFREHELPEAIGIGSFGPVDLDPESSTWGHVTTTPKPQWRNASVAPRIRDELGVPVTFDHDVAAAAYGEYTWGAGQGLRSVAYLTVGTGIGVGLVIGGSPWYGALQPEVGHIRIPRVVGDTYAGSCPWHGDCWEGLACGPALAARYGCDPVQLPDDHPAWELEAEYMAAGILAIALVVSPHRLVVGGGIGRRGHLLDRVRQRVRELFNDYLHSPLFGDQIDSYLVTPELGADAGVLGAVALARDAQRRATPSGP
jgi:fructokinase